MRGALAIALLLAGAAAAQEDLGEYEPVAERLGAEMTACLGASDTREGDAACADRLGALCVEIGPAGETTYGLAACTQALTRAWDGELNRLWPSAVAAGGERLRNAQRAWIAFRDAECLFEAARWEGGSMGAYAGGFCVAGMTAERVADLRALLREGG
jgi:uncharacterized protein YecT (DUF1311 family)